MILLVTLLVFGTDSSLGQNATNSPEKLAYAQVVKRVYMQAWGELLPAFAATNSVASNVTKVSVVIAKNGNVITAKILKPSADEKMDKSVQEMLDKISFVQPFENGAKDEQRTFIINFQVKT